MILQIMPQTTEIVKLISELKLVQLIDLINELEQMFKIPTSPSNQVKCPATCGDIKVTVLLTSPGPNKINVIKEIRAILELGLKESKQFVESVPQVIKGNLASSEANELKRRLEKVGASVMLR
ncbi:MAG: ribosomal protein bL12 [Arsenophonus sp. ET-DL9-MAG3]